MNQRLIRILVSMKYFLVFWNSKLSENSENPVEITVLFFFE